MKKTIITLTVLMSSYLCYSQKDSAQIKPPPDSVAFISTRDMDEFMKWLPENVSKAAYEKLKPEDTIILFYRWAVAEWNRKQKKK